ncbi:MAG: CoA-binding protein, partial [Deltaproteobacteria bacterium CG_4_9_14_3_um_filter_44_9]
MENVAKVESVNESSVVEQLDYVFNPSSVAVIGASNRIGTWGFGVMNRLIGNPKRKVYPVNSKSDEVMGIKAYRKITDIPYPVEFAVLSVPTTKTPEVMRECVAKGVKAALVITGGLAESGEEGAKLE